MLKVAITGNIAAGKSVLEEVLKQKGYGVFDTDCVAHNLLNEPAIKKLIIATFFGLDILENGIISRSKLGKIVFSNEYRRKALEKILHPAIKEEIKRFFRQLGKEGEKIAFVAIPLLFEAGFQDIFDKIILVYANDDIRLERLMKRNNLPLEYAKQRLEIQISQEEKTSLADYVIYNNSTLDDFNQEIEKVLNLF